jgi:hypothetical protein
MIIIIIVIILILATVGFFVYNFLFKPKDEIVITTTEIPRIFNSVKPISKESNKIQPTKKIIKTFLNDDEQNINLLGNLRQNKIITNSEGEEVKVPKRFAFKSFSNITNIANKPQEGRRVGWVQELEKVTMPPRHQQSASFIKPKYNKFENTNCVQNRITEIKKSGVSNGSGYTYLGEFDSYEKCLKEAENDPFSEAITYFGQNSGVYNKQCYKINDQNTKDLYLLGGGGGGGYSGGGGGSNSEAGGGGGSYGINQLTNYTRYKNESASGYVYIFLRNATQQQKLYDFEVIYFISNKSGPIGPTLNEFIAPYTNISWIKNTEFLNMNKQGILEWTVPVSGNYEIQAKGADSYGPNGFGKKISVITSLIKGEIIKILIGQRPSPNIKNAGAGGTFVIRNQLTPIIIAGGGGGGGVALDDSWSRSSWENSHSQYKNVVAENEPESATINNTGNNGKGNNSGTGGTTGGGGNGTNISAGGGGLNENGKNNIYGGFSFSNGGNGGINGGGFGGGGSGGTGIIPDAICGIRDPSTPAEKITRLSRSCDRGKKEILDNKSCAEASQDDELTEQVFKNRYNEIGTVGPGWDCWDQEIGRCITLDCLNNNYPGEACPIRKWSKEEIRTALRKKNPFYGMIYS